MVTVNLAHAKSHLSELLDKVEGGEDIVITRHGKPSVRMTAAQPAKKPLDLDALAKFRATMPRWSKPSARLIREMRDEDP